MFDDEFWEYVGGAGFSEEKKNKFKAVVVEELELRVGGEISSCLSSEQMREFDELAEDDFDYADSWLRKNYPDFREREVFKKFEAKGFVGDALIIEVANALWFGDNVPDYAEIVDKHEKKIRQEIISHFNDKRET